MPGTSVRRVVAAAAKAELAIEVIEMPASTRTAKEAAAACGCATSQIVKSLVFTLEGGEDLVILLVAGDRQANLDSASKIVGSWLKRADPKVVREKTGFAIGGVAPLGHVSPVPVYMDRNLLHHDTVWAAAGAPNAVFSVNPNDLRLAVGAELLP